MRHKWAFIGGGSALLVAGIVATQSGNPPAPDVAAPPTATAAPQAAPPAATAAPQPTPAIDAAVETARLEAELAETAADNARLRQMLAVRDAVLQTLRATAAEREARLADVQATLAASDAEVRALQQEIAALRAPRSFDEAIAALKPPAEASAARIEAGRADAGSLDAIFVAAKAPALPPVAVPAAPSRIEVQFDFASARLSPGAQARTQAAAVALAEMTVASVRVVGHTDRVGGPASNRRLAGKRARAVADALVAAGMPDARIEVVAMGETDAPVATDDGVAEPMNRSVTIEMLPL